MQATVSSFDADTGAGTLLLDDGVELAFGPDAIAGTGLRLLRPGQRVRIETAARESPGDGTVGATGAEVTRLQILTLT
jgi:cold shock CspA family protein